MKNSILPAVVILYIALWSIGFSGWSGTSNLPDKSGQVMPCRETRFITGVFFIDNFLNSAHPAETIVEYMNTLENNSIRLLDAIWTKGIKDPVVAEYEYLINLGNTLKDSLKPGSFLSKAIEFSARFTQHLLASD
jgi:hypothetical protein